MVRALADPDSVHEALTENARILETHAKHLGVRRAEVRAATAAVVDGDRTRAPYVKRVAAQ